MSLNHAIIDRWTQKKKIFDKLLEDIFIVDRHQQKEIIGRTRNRY